MKKKKIQSENEATRTHRDSKASTFHFSEQYYQALSLPHHVLQLCANSVLCQFCARAPNELGQCRNEHEYYLDKALSVCCCTPYCDSLRLIAMRVVRL